MNARVEWELPSWAGELAAGWTGRVADPHDRVRLAIALAAASSGRGGGPFGAVVCDRASGRILGVGVNVVVASGCSHAHAEMTALALAERAAGSWTLAGIDAELATSTAPCAMCLGAIAWSGVRALVCAARGEDAEAIGFDEGPKSHHWRELLRRRGVELVEDVLRDDAVAVLRSYRGPIYNAR